MLFFSYNLLGEKMNYIVKAGDTLYGISNQFGVSVTELAELNGIKGDNLQIGEVLKIPGSSGENPNNMFMYTVKTGDTLYSIAKKYNTTVQKIIDLNYLKSTNLTVGEVLRIPEMYTKEEDMVLPNYINYIVKRGDTLYSIAKANNISVDTLIKDNNLSGSLQIGEVIKIRVPDSNMMIEECIGTEYIPPISTNPTLSYVVKKGDSLYTIANKYNTSISEIKKINNLTSDSLVVGQVLKIPQTSGGTSQIYVVKNGDNLYAIARKFNTSVDSIKKKNSLTSNNLQIGQKLII